MAAPASATRILLLTVIPFLLLRKAVAAGLCRGPDVIHPCGGAVGWGLPSRPRWPPWTPPFVPTSRTRASPFSAGDLHERHRPVFVERAGGRFGDAQCRDAVLG